MKINEVLSSPDVTHFFANPGEGKNLNTSKIKKNMKMPKISSIQDKYFAKNDKQSHSSSDTKDLDDYLAKVEKKYHEIRKKEWEKAYKENYRTRFPKDGVYGPEL